MRFIPAWKQARTEGQKARNGAMADRASQEDDTISQQILKNQLTMMFKRYDFSAEDRKCFFCGDRGHHTGHLTGYGSIWLCKDKACAAQYNSAKEDL